MALGEPTGLDAQVRRQLEQTILALARASSRVLRSVPVREVDGGPRVAGARQLRRDTAAAVRGVDVADIDEVLPRTPRGRVSCEPAAACRPPMCPLPSATRPFSPSPACGGVFSRVSKVVISAPSRDRSRSLLESGVCHGRTRRRTCPSRCQHCRGVAGSALGMPPEQIILHLHRRTGPTGSGETSPLSQPRRSSLCASVATTPAAARVGSGSSKGDSEDRQDGVGGFGPTRLMAHVFLTGGRGFIGGQLGTGLADSWRRDRRQHRRRGEGAGDPRGTGRAWRRSSSCRFQSVP